MATKVLQTTKKGEIINKKKFAVIILNAEDEIYIIYIVALVEPMIMLIYLSC